MTVSDIGMFKGRSDDFREGYEAGFEAGAKCAFKVCSHTKSENKKKVLTANMEELLERANAEVTTMTVGEFIEKLKGFDHNLKVYYAEYDPSGADKGYSTIITDIEETTCPYRDGKKIIRLS